MATGSKTGASSEEEEPVSVVSAKMQWCLVTLVDV